MPKRSHDMMESHSEFQNPIKGYDFTIPADKYASVDELTEVVRDWFNKYVFQLEEGENGYRHYQGRGWLIKKRRFNEIKGKIPYFHLSPTTKGVHKSSSFEYAMKADTRVEGPWSDADYEPPPVLTRQLEDFLGKSLYPWQEDCLKLMEEEDDRRITLIYDVHGCAGKSILCEYAEYKKLGFEMPPMRQLEDIMSIAMCVKTQTCYLIDMPRAMKKDKLAEFYSGLESLKNGKAYDKRYSYRQKRFDRPQVIVFTNKLPAWEFMSKDRWTVYVMKPDKTMVQTPIEDFESDSD